MGNNKRRHWVPVKCTLLLVRKKGFVCQLTRGNKATKLQKTEVLASIEETIVHLMRKSNRQQMTNKTPGKTWNKKRADMTMKT